jgi:iron complex outermembrane receptor protein
MARVLTAIIVTLVLPVSTSGQQPGRITGVVTDRAAQPLVGIEVAIEGSTQRTLTNAAGFFVLIDVPAGTHTLRLAGAAGASVRHSVTLRAGEAQELRLRLDLASFSLAGIVITALGRSYAEGTSALGSRTELPLLELAQSLNVVSESVINDRQEINVKETIQHVSGVNYGRSATTELVIRGFNDNGAVTNVGAGGSLFLINGLRNYLSDYASDVMLVNVERVEVLKGANGVLHGFNQPGGVVNLVTKRPQPTARQSFQLGAGTWGRYRLAAD